MKGKVENNKIKVITKKTTGDREREKKKKNGRRWSVQKEYRNGNNTLLVEREKILLDKREMKCLRRKR